jgi:hypothetical protein
MSAVAERLEVPYRVFTMWKNGGQALANFKAHPGAVLLAAGAVWEGIDFPGDCVSLLIIPRLPFAVPDARAAPEGRYHRATLEALPEMQCTSDLEDINQFMLEHKTEQFFKPANKKSSP